MDSVILHPSDQGPHAFVSCALAHLQVSLAALPPGISLPAAEALLFVGKAVRILARPGTPSATAAAPPTTLDFGGFRAALRRLQRQAAFSHLELERAVTDVHSMVGSPPVTCSVWDLKHLEP